MNYTLLAWLAYAIVTALGMVGLGNIFWSVIKNNLPLPKPSAPIEHPLFIVGLSFFLGYLLYEELLYLLAAVQLFRPVIVTIAASLLPATGIGWLILRKLALQKHALILVASPLETAVLAAMIMFVYVNLSSQHHGPTTLNRDANRGLPLPQLPGRQPNYMLKNSQAFLNLRAGDK
jgi:hypothetical protein